MKKKKIESLIRSNFQKITGIEASQTLIEDLLHKVEEQKKVKIYDISMQIFIMSLLAVIVSVAKIAYICVPYVISRLGGV